MQSADDATVSALAAGERTTTHTTRLGGKDVSAQVQSWQLERSYATDLPAAMRAFSGSSAAQLQVELSGTAGKSAPELYSPWADRTTGDVVRPGQSVVHENGVGGAKLPAFRGTIRSRSATSGTDSVQITALDGAERLRGPAVLPKPDAGFRLSRPVSSATWCVSELLRQGGLYACPPPRYPTFEEGKPLTLVYASLHGGFSVPYGQPASVPAPSTYVFSREGAPHEMALVPKSGSITASWTPRSRITVPGTSTVPCRILAELWVNNAISYGDIDPEGDAPRSNSDKVVLQLELNRNGATTGQLKVEVDFAEEWVRLVSMDDSATGGWFSQWSWRGETQRGYLGLKGVWHIGAYFECTGTGTTIQPRLTAPDGTQLVGGASTLTQTTAIQKPAELQTVTLITEMPTECVQVSSGVSGMPEPEEFAQSGTVYGWTKSVELDDVILPLYTLPRVSGSQWEVISQIAKASMSTAEIDERGVFRWKNYSRFATKPTTADLTLTSVREIASLTATEEIDACRNYCIQPYKDWTGITSAVGTTLTDQVVRTIAAGKTTTVKYLLSDDEYDVDPPTTDDDTIITPGTNVRFATTSAGTTAVKGMVDLMVRREDGYLVVRFSNRDTRTLYTATKTGTPSFYLETRKPSADPVERQAIAMLAPTTEDPDEDGVASEKFYGRQEYTAEATDWVQDAGTALALAQAMRAAGVLPVPVIGDVEVLYDPRIQLGDVVRVVDTTGAVLDTLAWVIGIRTSATADGGVQQTLTLRGVDPGALPADEGLTRDVPSSPATVTYATYASVTSAFPTLAALTASGLTWGEIKESADV
ncbi:hypothetical protein Sipo8835_46245 [Streptomyces ipomoeae]|uniref:Uncharacterized protein n=2 Tax=Streptomyces ipomoeae TaxID=103232 RepID=L1L363_9ACTN|nr:hypothetical protein [Streptomyces ipomoeae]EKX67145.1 hypothetical protein STRIP9103_03546 [Streptomyces ipomoeae 91-03]MDX2698095.1 hypothetical protein [Streptomyces ipomoeae]MDX2844476.1 hypothetical protein [Streptomyces ipomoeae]TQE15193.1 hypothetical protein Sipo8835_46245 [Streptomyces ipomoeae]TQE25585.1 hypothetical protein Sipo7851_34575 [Streptomyces ipomoeae]